RRAGPAARRARGRAHLPRRAELPRRRAARPRSVRDAQVDYRARGAPSGAGSGGVRTALIPKFTFETFVIGAANRLAVTAARTVAESPGSAYNPLFIYSGSGLGKTHLLMAIGAAAKRLAADLNV